MSTNQKKEWEIRLRATISGTPQVYGIGVTEEAIIEQVRLEMALERDSRNESLVNLRARLSKYEDV